MQPFCRPTAVRSLPALVRALDDWHDRTFAGHGLRPVPGGGADRRPDHMFVFINPTVRNASSAADWAHARYPFVGTKPLWRILYRAGWLPPELMAAVEDAKIWDGALTKRMHDWLAGRSLYMTNLVKRSGHDAALPNAELVRLFRPYLLEEIRLVRPRRIVTFGLMPFAALSDARIKLCAVHGAAMRSGMPTDFAPRPELGLPAGTRITPLHFPIGRGNPQPAIDLLRLLRPQA